VEVRSEPDNRDRTLAAMDEGTKLPHNLLNNIRGFQMSTGVSMRSAAISIIWLTMMCLATAAQSPKSANDETGQIMALESAWNQAEVQHDTRAMGMLLGETYTYTDSDGSVLNKNQWLALMKKETASFEQLGNSGIKVYLYGSVAMVTGGYRERVRQKRNVIVRSGRFIDVWIKQNGYWKCVGGQATLIIP
jgi:hypothetical protein